MGHIYPGWSQDFFKPSRYKEAHGGRGSTKSWTVARLLIEIAARVPIRWLCAREIQKSISESVHKLLKDQIEELGYSHLFNINDRMIRGVNGSEFIFEGIKLNVNKIKSLEGLDGAWVEEAEKVSAESWRVLRPTIRKPSTALADFYKLLGHKNIGDAVKSEIWVTFNPDEETDPTSQMFIVNPMPECIHKTVNFGDNPWFVGSPLEAEMLHDYRVDPEIAEHVWGGKFRANTKSQIFAHKVRVEDFEPGVDWDGPWYGMDFGFSQDPFACYELWAKGNTLYAYREAWGIKVELNDIPGLVKRQLPRLAKRKHKIYADCSRPETISHLRAADMDVSPAEKWPGSVEDGIAYLRSLDGIVIHKTNCPHAQDDARYYRYKVVNDIVTNKIVDAWNHFWDAVRYALYKAIQAQEHELVGEYQSPVMTTGGISPDLEAFELETPQFGVL